jgi:hypothetical protein
MDSKQYIYDAITPKIKVFFSQYIKSIPSKMTDGHEINRIQIHQDQILLFTTNLLEKYGFKCKSRNEYTEYDFIIEFHKYALSGKKVVVSQLCTHIDDETGCNAKVNTFIYYIEKTETIDGGDLIMYSDKGDEKIKIKSDSFLMMRGDIEHGITPLFGVGVRTCIVVQIPRKE